MKMLISILLLISSFNIFCTETILTPSANHAYFKDNLGDVMPLRIAYSTDGAGNLRLINSANPVDDNILIPPNSGKMFLEANDGNTYPAIVVYTTDGAGNILPITGGSGSSTSYVFDSPLYLSGIHVRIPPASLTSNGYMATTTYTTFNNKEPAITASTTATYYRGDKTFQNFDSAAQAAISASSPLAYLNGIVSVASGYSIPSNASTSSWDAKQIAGNYITKLTGDVSASGPNSATATVNSVGGSVASLIHSAELLANAATSSSSTNTIVMRDSLGTFHAGPSYFDSDNVQVGGVGSYGRTKLWNYGPEAELRLGSLAGDGDAPGNIPANGEIIIGFDAAEDTMTQTTWGYARIKPNRFGLLQSLADVQNYYFLVDGTELFLANDAGTKTFDVTRSTGNIQTSLGSGIVQSDSSGNLSSASPTLVTSELNAFIGDNGASTTLKGLVPAPTIGQTASGAFLSANGSFVNVDQSKTRYSDFQLISQTSPATTSAQKFQNIAIQGNYAYLVGGANPGITFAIYDITSQSSPKALGYIQTASGNWSSGPSYLNGAYNLAINGNYAYICSSGSSNIYVVNITNPNNPYNVSRLTIPNTPGSIYGCAFQNGLLYLATQSQGLDVVDVGNGSCGGTLNAPTNCFQEGGGVKSFGVAVSGNYVYTTQYITSVFGTRQIKSWALSASGTPSTPYLLQSLQVTTVGEPLGLTLNGNTAYVGVLATGVNAIDLIDITTPSAMSNVSVITPSYTLNSAEVAIPDGKFLYIPSGANVIHGGAIDLYDISNRSSPVKITSTYTNVASSVFGGIALDGKGYIYAADYGVAPGANGTMDIFTKPTSTSTVGSFLAERVNITSMLNIPVQALSSTPTCADGNISLTNAHILCVCSGSTWVKVSDGITGCTF